MKGINEPSILGFEVPTETFTTPSGFRVTIREANGQDDAILSNLQDAQQGAKALNKYLVNVVTELNSLKVIKINDILKLRVRDKYYILFKVRMLSLGTEVRWTQRFEDGGSQEFVEDLKQYDWDYSKGNPPLKGEEGYNPLVAAPYNKEPYVRFELSSGHLVQFDYMTGVEEKAVLGVDESTVDINFRLTIRNFKLFKDKDEDTGLFVENFKIFPSRIMAEIRARLETYDSEWTLASDVKNPKTNQVTTISLLSVPDFFFPGA